MPFAFLYVKILNVSKMFCNNHIMSVKLMSVKYFAMLFFVRIFANELMGKPLPYKLRNYIKHKQLWR